MKFTVAVMQYTGNITDRSEQALAKVQSTDVGHRLVTGFGLMVAEQLPQLLNGTVKASTPLFDGNRGLLEWRQADYFSALATFFLDKKLKFTWFLFSGHDPNGDAIAVSASADLIKIIASESGVNVDPGKGFTSIRERPVAVCVPWPPSPSAQDQRMIGNMAVCLAAAFFEQIDKVCRDSKEFVEKCNKFAERWERFGEN